MKKLLFLLLLSTTFSIAQVTDITLCSTDADHPNTAIFDLSTQNTNILNGSDPATHTISYYLSNATAIAASNAIANETNYSNTSNPQTIYARNTNTNDNTYTIVSFNLIVNATIAAPTGSSPIAYCDTESNTIADITPLITSDTNLIFWDEATAGNQLAETTPLTDGMTVWISQSISPCAARLMIDIQIYPAESAPSTTANPLQFCSQDNSTLADVTPQVTGTNIIYWDTATGGNQLAGTTVLTNGMTVWASQGTGICSARLMIEIQVEATTIVGCPFVSPLQFCSASNPTLADVTPQLTGNNVVYWDDATAGNQLAETTPLTDNMAVWASQGLGQCAERRIIAIQLSTPVAAPTLDTTPLQLPDNATIADLTSNVTGQNLIIWDVASGAGNQLDATTPLACDMSVWFSQGTGSCAERLEIAITCQTDTNGNTVYNCARMGGTAGISTIILSDTKVSPNPSSGIINIFSENRNETLAVTVFNITGQLVYATKLEVNESQIDLAMLNKGVYFLQFSTKQSSETRRLILK